MHTTSHTKKSRLGIILFLLWICWTSASSSTDSLQIQTTDDRLALVIGNRDYKRKPLINPINDARDIKTALEQDGFRVIYRENANLTEMDNAVRQFVHQLRRETVAVVYYSGHGAQADGVNYLIPVGADIESKSELKARAYDAGIILDEMQEVGNRINVVILDACRNNPFKGQKGGSDGIASMYGPKGTLIAYSTAPGSVADDNTSGRNGLYTTYLKKYLVQPGLTVEEMFKKVREGVVSENQDQVPWENSSIIGDFCFAGCQTNQTSAIQSESVDAESLFWDRIHNSKKTEDFQAYLSQYPRGRFVVQAYDKLVKINRQNGPTCEYCPEMVALPSGIKMGKFEVTQGQWRAIMGNNPSKFTACGENCPVENVSWRDVQNYIQRLNAKTGHHYRLPTENEWYTACQAGSTNKEYCDSDNLDSVAWHRGDSGPTTHPVGKKSPNAWHLYDMSGNVWEWTSTCETAECSRRYVRGGSWDGMPAFVRSAVRIKSVPSERFVNLGFRLAQD